MNENQPIPKRPVRCAVCQKDLFYQGDPKHEPELQVTLELPKWQAEVTITNFPFRLGIGKAYIHVRCWNALPIILHPSIKWAEVTPPKNGRAEVN